MERVSIACIILSFFTLFALPLHASGHTVGINPHRHLVWGIAVSEDGRYILATTQEGVLLIFDATSCVLENLAVPSPIDDSSFERHMLTGLASRPNRQEFATAMRDRTVRLWSLRDGEIREQGTYLPTPSSTTEGPRGLRTVAFSPDGAWLAAAGHGPQIFVWRTDKPGPPVHILDGHDETINTIGFGRDHLTLWSAGMNGIIHFYDVTQQTERQIRTAGPILNAVMSSDWRYIATTSVPDEEATLYDVDSGVEVRRWRNTPRQSVWALAFSPDNRLLATGMRGDESQIRLLEIEHGRELWTAVVPSGDWTFSLAFSPNGRSLIAGVYGNGPYLLDLESGAIVKRYGGGTCNLIND